MLYLLFTIIGILIGFIPTYIICWKKPKGKILEINEKIRNQNLQIENENLELINFHNKLKDEISQTNIDIETLKQRKTEYSLDIEKSKEDAYKATNLFLQEAQANFEAQMEKLGEKYQNAESDYINEYETMVQDLVNSFSKQVQNAQEAKAIQEAEIKAEITKLLEQINNLKGIVDATTEVQRRAELERTEKDFYRLILSKEDLEEIAELRSIKLRDATALNKVIWKVYYENPYTALIGRVIGQEKKTGIYKITNLINGMCYVGQSVDIAERWKQHIKRGIGADTPTKNKLYPAMMEFGVENFTFEVIEVCERAQLDEKEDYYQNFYHTKDFGYSIK